MSDTPNTLPPLVRSLRPLGRGDQTAAELSTTEFEWISSALSGQSAQPLGGLIVLTVLILLIFFGLRGRKDAKPKRDVRHDQSSRNQRHHSPLSIRQPGHFDAETTRQSPRSKVLLGKAWVTDGDTIVINKTQVRLFGIDAPEINHPFGEKAKWAMVRLCNGHMIKAVVTDVDHYGRTVARCSLPDGRDLSAELVKMGLAIDWPRYSGGKYAHLERAGVRRRLWLADARQRGKMYLWEQFEYDQQRRQHR